MYNFLKNDSGPDRSRIFLWFETDLENSFCVLVDEVKASLSNLVKKLLFCVRLIFLNLEGQWCNHKVSPPPNRGIPVQFLRMVGGLLSSSTRFLCFHLSSSKPPCRTRRSEGKQTPRPSNKRKSRTTQTKMKVTMLKRPKQTKNTSETALLPTKQQKQHPKNKPEGQSLDEG